MRYLPNKRLIYLLFLHIFVHSGNIVKDELETMLKEMTLAYFKAILQYPPGSGEENHKTIRTQITGTVTEQGTY